VNCLTATKARMTIQTISRNTAMGERPPRDTPIATEFEIVEDSPLEPVGQYDPADDFAKSIDFAYDHIRKRKANGGKGWRE
jgi:hypothetical protein